MDVRRLKKMPVYSKGLVSMTLIARPAQWNRVRWTVWLSKGPSQFSPNAVATAPLGFKHLVYLDELLSGALTLSRAGRGKGRLCVPEYWEEWGGGGGTTAWGISSTHSSFGHHKPKTVWQTCKQQFAKLFQKPSASHTSECSSKPIPERQYAKKVSLN